MIIAGVDTETTGFHDDSEVVEVGYVIYDADKDMDLASGSELFKVKNWDETAEEASLVHGISKEQSELADQFPEDVAIDKRILKYNPKIIVAHNAEFDHPKMVKHWPELSGIPWICTWRDLKHEDIIKARIVPGRLMYLAVEYGIPVMGWHRASSDASIACKIAAKHNLAEALVRKARPRYIVKTIGPFNANLKDKFREMGFRWNPSPKHYFKEDVSENDVPVISKMIRDEAPNWRVDTVEMPPRPY
jgi:DNA polymerase III epsilon subunit-like protein